MAPRSFLIEAQIERALDSLDFLKSIQPILQYMIENSYEPEDSVCKSILDRFYTLTKPGEGGLVGETTLAPLRILCQLVEESRRFAKTVDETSPETFYENVAIHKYTLSVSLIVPAMTLFSVFYRNCPRFKEYEKYFGYDTKVTKMFSNFIKSNGIESGSNYFKDQVKRRPLTIYEQVIQKTAEEVLQNYSIIENDQFSEVDNNLSADTPSQSSSVLPISKEKEEKEKEKEKGFNLNDSGINEKEEKDSVIIPTIEQMSDKVKNSHFISLQIQREVAIIQVNIAYKYLKKALQEKNVEKVKECYESLIKSQEGLSKILKMIVKKNIVLFSDKGSQIDEKDANERSKAIELLKMCYDVTEQLIPLGEKVADELIIISNLIIDVCKLNIAISLCGSIKTGKSTLLNCFVGRNFSPDRVDPMTAIPFRYIHQDVEEAYLIVPFPSQLNCTLEKIKQVIDSIIQEYGKEALDFYIPLKHLRELAYLIQENKLVIHKKYIGTQEIRNISKYIHDLFRLAALDVFETAIEFLPLDWNRGQDHLLSVYCKFPHFENKKLNVNFSMIDSPGIDESNVVKLNLSQVLKDCIGLSQMAILVVSVHTFKSSSLDEVKSFIDHVREKWKVPILVVGTHKDQVMSQNLKGSISQAYSTTSQFTFLVSSTHYKYSKDMLSFIERNNKKPEYNDNDKNGEESKIALNFANTLCLRTEDALKNYKNYDEDSIKSDCEALIKSSGVQNLIGCSLKESVQKGAQLCISVSKSKALEEMEKVLKNLERLKSQSILDTKKLDEYQNFADLVEDSIGSLIRNIEREKKLALDRLKTELDTHLKNGNDQLNNFATGGLSKNSTQEPELLKSISSYINESTYEVFYQNGNEQKKITFKNFEDAGKLADECRNALIFSCQSYMSNKALKVDCIHSFSTKMETFKGAVESILKKLKEDFQGFGIQSINSEVDIDDVVQKIKDTQQTSIGMGMKQDLIKEKKSKILIFSKPTLEIKSLELRGYLKDMGQQILKIQRDILYDSFKSILEKMIENYSSLLEERFIEARKSVKSLVELQSGLKTVGSKEIVEEIIRKCNERIENLKN